MKRLISLSLFVFVTLSLTMAQASLLPLEAKSARTMGMGGSFTTLATGFDSLFGNPAGFSSAKGQLTIADLSTWAYIKPTQANITAIQDVLKDSKNVGLIAGTAQDLISENGFGGGFSLGLGYTGHSIGVGAYAIADVVASGSDALTAKMKGTATFNAVVGLGIPIKLGPLTLAVGADIRPFVRVEDDGTWLVSGLLGAVVNNSPIGPELLGKTVNSGFGLATDVGVQLRLGGLSAGLSIRDLTRGYKVESGTLEDLTKSTSSLFDAVGVDTTIDPTLAAGLAWQPRFLKGFLEPGFYAEFKAPVSMMSSIGSAVGDTSPWNYMHLGANIKFLTIFDFRAGLNQGYVSVGAGLNLYLIEIDAALFTQELGLVPGEQGRSGFSVQAALHL